MFLQGYVYSPMTDALVLVRELPASTKLILWDQSPADKEVLVGYDGETLHTFIVDMDNVAGPSVTFLGMTRIPLGQHPILVFSGEVSLQTQSGKLVKLTLSTHTITANIGDLKTEELRELLQSNIKLGRLINGWAICDLLNSEEDWERLAKAALERLEVEFGIRVYRNTRNISMVWSLEELKVREHGIIVVG